MINKKTKYLSLVFWTTSILYVALVMHLPVSLLATAGHDDGLFIRNAQNIFSGNWLGPYSQMTLAKGPGYSLFIAANGFLGLPLTLSNSLLYLLSCIIIIKELRRIGLSEFYCIIAFMVIIFQPAIFPVRIVRENIYVSLTLLVVAGLINLSYPKEDRKFGMTKNVLFGLTLGFFWITREEGVWVLPALLFYFSYLFAIKYKDKIELKKFLMKLIVYLMSASTIPLIVSSINLMAYGKFEIVDFTSGEYKKALSKISSVQIEPEISHIPVPYKKRELIYKVSPAFRELEPYFESRGRAWQEPGCSVYKYSCGDYAGGWFMWALRDGVADAGYYANPVKAEKFYSRISSEIDAACMSGQLKCKSKIFPFIPNIPFDDIKNLPHAFFKAIWISFSGEPYLPIAGSSTGDYDDVNLINNFLGNIRIVALEQEFDQIKIDGWFYSRDDDWIGIKCKGGDDIVTKAVTRLPSPDLVEHFGDEMAGNQRFSIVAKKSDACKIYLKKNASTEVEIKDIFEMAMPHINIGGDLLYIDSKHAKKPSYGFPLFIKVKLGGFYNLIGPAVSFFGLFAYVSLFIFYVSKKNKPTLLFVIASMLWLMCLSRVILIALIDISSFPAVNYLYISPILPLVGVLSIASIFLLVIELGKFSKIIPR